MPKLEPPDNHHLSAATGWIELGNFGEAAAELARIRPAFARHPDVLEVWWAVHAHREDWVRGLEAACALVEAAPERAGGWLHQAYALRRVSADGLQAAWDALLPAAQRFPREPTIPYNLACYACQMNRLDAAREWFRRALRIGGKEPVKQMALADDDLKPLWEEIGGM
jgi:tetratricopeptide (TPR) repeat protein